MVSCAALFNLAVSFCSSWPLSALLSVCSLLWSNMDVSSSTVMTQYVTLQSSAQKLFNFAVVCSGTCSTFRDVIDLFLHSKVFALWRKPLHFFQHATDSLSSVFILKVRNFLSVFLEFWCLFGLLLGSRWCKYRFNLKFVTDQSVLFGKNVSGYSLYLDEFVWHFPWLKTVGFCGQNREIYFNFKSCQKFAAILFRYLVKGTVRMIRADI